MVDDMGSWKWREFVAMLPTSVLQSGMQDWDVFFGIVLWMLWKHQNLWVFDPDQLNNFRIWMESCRLLHMCIQMTSGGDLVGRNEHTAVPVVSQ
ncbi:hypothetical protein V6N13_096835 [Hibiscus sabdariffa]